jgi:hypothetical protein
MSVTLRSFIRLCRQSVVVLAIIVLLVACGGNDEPVEPPTVEATPAAGGMVMPTLVVAETGVVTESVVVDPQAAAPPSVALLIGDAVAAQADQGLRLYNDATATAMVMNVYATGEQLTVLDPSGDYASYPVENGGRLWYRLRAPDGLVGWGAADQIVGQ